MQLDLPFNDLIFEIDLWKVVLNPNQFYLGRSVVVLKRPCGELSGITPEEWNKLRDIIARMEAAGKKVFGATMFNWSCLMNLAYQNNPPDPQIHWHFLPRYRNPVTFAEVVFIDEHFGRRSVDEKRAVSVEVLEQIRDALKHALS